MEAAPFTPHWELSPPCGVFLFFFIANQPFFRYDIDDSQQGRGLNAKKNR